MSETLARRARSMAEMGAVFDKMFVGGEIGAAIGGFRPRETDVIISPFGKCGTTWLQQTFHCLRTGGDMDFDDISRVVPWIETSGALGIDLNAEQRANPRGFKSHLPYGQTPQGARYIVAIRDPRDAFLSMYKFMEGWIIEPGAISVEEFAVQRVGVRPEGGDYWSHLLSWWAHKDDPNVLLVSYEHMTADPEWMVRQVAQFAGLPLSDELLALTLEKSSLPFMLAHKDRFDDAMMRALSERRANIPPGSDSAKVRQGGVGGHRQGLPESVVKSLDDTWATAITPVLGFADYAALEADLRQRASA
jgi:hypothetical protein